MDKKNIVKKYSKEGVTVRWEPSKCIHSTICFSGLPEVFDPNARPWVNIEGATSEKIIEQVRKCPSQALSIIEDNKTSTSSDKTYTIELFKDGPILVKSPVSIVFSDGSKGELKANTALCRCGASSKKPFCDGSHRKVEFNG